ncbi:Mitochondrial succinate-fumarate transporter [Basidiobolus ranarum]|uniref:Mitochondrial succinate-fumarate transporter n=1 Tax=Basidiobolus ranarum TaxID=34480 RepID=A0ABR2WPJ5_9FUNG
MSKSSINMSSDRSRKKNFSTHLIAGGSAGFVEACICHPLDTVKVFMQLRTNSSAEVRPRSFFGTGVRIVKDEGLLALYRGLGVVVMGIVPKMSIRFSSFELYKSLLANKETGNVSTTSVFVAGLAAGVTESIMVVCPTDVVKIRLQTQHRSKFNLNEIPKYRTGSQTFYTIIREEGIGALYKGVTLTCLRQATNQGVNFTAYQEGKKHLLAYQDISELPSYQALALGGISGAMGPMCNAPIDTIKTRVQKASMVSNESGWAQFTNTTASIIRNEGYRALYKGLTPRLLRVAPGQAITFMVYEKVSQWMDIWPSMLSLKLQTQ